MSSREHKQRPPIKLSLEKMIDSLVRAIGETEAGTCEQKCPFRSQTGLRFPEASLLANGFPPGGDRFRRGHRP